MLVALWAALAMVVQDTFMTLMVQAEARNRWVMAGLLDCAGWLAQIATISMTTIALFKHGLDRESIAILASVTVANFVGTAGATLIGKRWIK